MSAVAALAGPQSQVSPERHRSPGVPRRAHLRLVPPGERAPAQPGLRLTVRGRRLIVLLLAVAALVVGAAVATAGPGESGPVVTVRSGQTLTELARTQLPNLPVTTAIAQIQLANGLNSLHISAGQRLVMPPR